MTDFFQNLLDSSFTPHGQAYLMRSEIIWTHVISDGLIALSYFLILAALVYFVRKRSDLSSRGIFLLCGFFLLAGGVAHLLEIWTVWHGIFRLTGVVKAATGVAAVATAVMLVKMVPQALALPSPEDLEQARLALESEKTERAHEQDTWSTVRDEFKRELEMSAGESRDLREALTLERADLDRLHELNGPLIAAPDLRSFHQEVVAGMLGLQSADLGTLQLYSPESGGLEVAAHSGVPPEALDGLRDLYGRNATWEKVLREGQCVAIEDVLADPDFEPHWPIAASVGFRAMQITPLVDRGGILLGFVSTHFRQQRRFAERDTRLALLYARQAAAMMQARQAETAQTKSDLHLRQLFAGLNDRAIFMLDPTGRIVIWNEGAERIAGFAASDILGKHFSLLYEPQESGAERAGEAMRLAVSNSRFEEVDERTTKDGQHYWSQMILTPLHDNAGALHGFAGVIQDVTERKRAEEELRRSEAYLTEAQKLSHTGSWGWSPSTGEIYWSPETFRIFGVNPRDVKPSQQLLLQFVHPDDRPNVENVLDTASREKSEFKAEFRIVLPDGSIRHVRSMGYPAQTGSGLAEFVGAVADVSGQKLAEETFRNAQAELARVARLTIDEYAASMAGAIGQSLEAIANNADFCFRLAEATRALPYESQEPLQSIVKDAGHAKEVLERARRDTALSERDRVSLEVEDLVLDVLALASSDLKRNKITVQTEFAENLPNIFGDRVELRHALLSLVANAIEAMNEEPDERRVLTIRTARDSLDRSEAVRIEVQDLGIGFSPEEKDRLFEPFHSTKPNRLGMGLRIGRSLVEAHGGRLFAGLNSGPGATFSCVLPSAPSREL